MIRERKYKLYKKWFKLGFKQQKQNGFNPNSYHNIDTSYRLTYPYKCTFKEQLPWNVHWTYLGYLDGYNVYRPHEEVSEELAELLDKKYGFDGGVYYKDEPWWEELP